MYLIPPGRKEKLNNWGTWPRVGRHTLCSDLKSMVNENEYGVGLHGMRTVAEALRGESYPIDLAGINYAVGDIDVSSHGGLRFAVRDLTDSLKAAEFRSAEEVVRALYQVLDQLDAKERAA
jgi:hypothetical protein